MADNLRSETHVADTHGEPGQAAAPAREVEVARGLGEPAAAHLVEDSYIGVRASHLQPAPRPLPPEQASGAVEAGELDVASEVQDAALIPPEPSVWEAIEEGEGE
jgi:hypothetical protein